MIGKLHRTPITIWYAHYSEKSYDGYLDGYIINLWTKIENSKNASFSIDYGEFKSHLIFQSHQINIRLLKSLDIANLFHAHQYLVNTEHH